MRKVESEDAEECGVCELFVVVYLLNEFITLC